MRIQATTAAIAGALVLCACGSQGSADMAMPDQTASAAILPPSEGVPSASAEAGVPATAQAFADMIAAGDLFEIESAKLASSMASSDAVKGFARMMAADHARSSADLKAAAGRAASAVQVDPKLTPRQQADLDRLKASGAGFDGLYAELQVAAHEKALATLQTYAKNGDSAPLREFAGNAAKVVAGHFEESQTLPR